MEIIQKEDILIFAATSTKTFILKIKFSLTNLIDLDLNWKRCFSIYDVYDILDEMLSKNKVIKKSEMKSLSLNFEYTFIKTKCNFKIDRQSEETTPEDTKLTKIKFLENYKLENQTKISKLEERTINFEKTINNQLKEIKNQIEFLMKENDYKNDYTNNINKKKTLIFYTILIKTDTAQANKFLLIVQIH